MSADNFGGIYSGNSCAVGAYESRIKSRVPIILIFVNSFDDGFDIGQVSIGDVLEGVISGGVVRVKQGDDNIILESGHSESPSLKRLRGRIRSGS